ncbi:carboxypeptidase s1 [Colletotrichum truncatum]|uniref:Carboxypeptidase s1 n=1 Tax=Colletotrichum truncatum TaxID=5467 RepID=A0ACC3YW18_COLTU|nr:carboxypeptidase s1 [Colletotrichum truncatum]KAF6791197.1 carboxypeptidase s1 [Colletotrichum truncatum]
MLSSAVVLLGGLISLTSAQFPPKPEGVKVLKSRFHENVTISYKEPGICETTPGVRSYAGYVHLPPGTLEEGTGEPQDYPINTFFWFFEARKAPENAPLAIWLNGGPGASSIMGLLEENGPCLVNEDSKTTRLNPWSWNNEVNILYIDQPNQVGFSYDILTNITVHKNEDGFIQAYPADFSEGVPDGNWTYRYGTTSSQQINQTASTTAQAAHALWHFAQTWFFEFPFYKPIDDRVSLWGESYGGHYAPGILKHFRTQNELIRNGSSTEDGAQYIHLDTLGIVNGLIDFLIQGETWITFPYNNTYGIQVFNQSIYEELMYNWTRPQGCREQVADCQDALKRHGPLFANDHKRNYTEICGGVSQDCLFNAVSLYQSMDNGWYDIGHPKHDPFPAPHLYGYLLESEILSSLGVPVNYSEASGAVGKAFDSTYDIILGGFRESIGYLLDNGVKVHLMYGDRDYACNWAGGEKASLAVPYKHSEEFANAGYAPLVTPDGITGMTRQFGNYSFSRVYQAGHEVPSYQPVTAYEIFMRATFNRDIATGLIPVTDKLSTIGPKDIWHIKNVPPQRPEPTCYVLKPDTCTPEEWEKLENGTALVKDYFVIGDVSENDDARTTEGAAVEEQQVFEEL